MSGVTKCPRCGGKMSDDPRYDVCHACRAELGPAPRYALCERGCGRRVFVWSKNRVCWRCRKSDEGKTPHVGPGHGRRVVLTSKKIKCKVCGKKFSLTPWQDARWTWYCPACRAQMAEITTGVTWLGNIGIDVPPEEEILMGSVADAYEEDDYETLLLQGEQLPGQEGDPVPGSPASEIADRRGSAEEADGEDPGDDAPVSGGGPDRRDLRGQA